MSMRNILKNNKFYVGIVVVFLVFTMGYWIHKRGKTINVDKEIVYLVLQDSSITNELREQVNKFNEKNKDIEIDYKSFGSSDYINIAITRLVNQRDIDIFEYFDSFLVDKKEISTLDSVGIDYSAIDDGANLNFNNEVVGVKYASSIPKMIINEDILNQAGIEDFKGINTFEDLMSVAKQIKENVPGVTPIGISTKSAEDNFMMFGMPSAMNSDVYPTFWNHSRGKYTFSEAAQSLEMYRTLYKEGLINNNFNEKNDKAIQKEFVEGKVAITFNQYYNKDFFVKNGGNMNIEIEDMPVFNKKDLNQRYYYSYNKMMVVRNYDKDNEELSDEEKEDTEEHKKAVKVVYEWLISDEVTGELIKTDSNFATFNKGNKGKESGNSFSGLNDDTNFKHTVLDPTVFLSMNKYLVRDTFTSLIKGDNDISSELIKLEKSINAAIEEEKDSLKVNLDMYKE